LKPAPFQYLRAHSVDEALQLLADYGDEAKILAGGQSLIPMMNYRLARPEFLVGIGSLEELNYVVRDADRLRVGALATHARLERQEQDSLKGGFEVISAVASHIGHPPIRTLGTIGGSLAHADPAAEWCATTIALDAFVVVRSASGGTRTVACEDLFYGFLTTALEPGEMIVEIVFPRPQRHTGFAEFSRRRGDFAVASVCVAVELEESKCSAARIVVGGVDSRPVRVTEAESLLVGTSCEAHAIEEAAAHASAQIEPIDETEGMASYRRHLTRTLTKQALTEAMRQ
jgi:carbon-monoxide dehydrogenase medium subunit